MLETIASALVVGYIIFKLERIDKRQDSIELRITLIEHCLPKRKGDGGYHGD
jgi:hypothetical protein